MQYLLICLSLCCPWQGYNGPQAPSAHQSMDLQWKVFYPEQLIAQHSATVDHVVVVTKGSVRMRFPVLSEGPHARAEEHVVVASVGRAEEA